MHLLQKLLTTALGTRNKQLQMPIIQHMISQLQAMHLLHGEVGTSTLGKIHKLLYLPVMLYSFIDTTKPLRVILKQTYRHEKGHFMFVAFFDANLVICDRQV